MLRSPTGQRHRGNYRFGARSGRYRKNRSRAAFGHYPSGERPKRAYGLHKANVCYRAVAAGIATKIGVHMFRATGTTAYLKNGGVLEKPGLMANHASTRATELFDRWSDEITLDDVERVRI